MDESDNGDHVVGTGNVKDDDGATDDDNDDAGHNTDSCDLLVVPTTNYIHIIYMYIYALSTLFNAAAD